MLCLNNKELEYIMDALRLLSYDYDLETKTLITAVFNKIEHEKEMNILKGIRNDIS